MPKMKKTGEDKGGAVCRSSRIQAAPKATQGRGTASKPLSKEATVDLANEKFIADEGLYKFTIIRQNTYCCAKKVNQENAKMQCDCIDFGGNPGCGSGCINRIMRIECGPLCRNGKRCTNKRFKHHKGWPCRVFRTEKKGCGIAAEFQIPQGEFIMEYVGEVIDMVEFEERLHQYATDITSHFYFMALSAETVIDATSKANMSRFINHSCDPNAETQKWVVNGVPRIGFFSLKTIQKGEEITFDYQYERLGRAAQRCYCEATNCRGWLGRKPDSDDENQPDKESGRDTELVEEAEQELGESLKITKATNRKRQAKSSAVGGSGSGEKASKQSKGNKFEDPDVLEELSLLNHSGLKDKQDTLRFSRCMVRAKLPQTRLQLLDILTHGELSCRRLFLDSQGLRLLHSWISQNGQDQLMRVALIDALESLPIPNRTMLDESRVFQSIRLWSRTLKLTQAGLHEPIMVLLHKWEALAEGGPIPKREDVEQVKEDEKDPMQQQLHELHNDPNELIQLAPDFVESKVQERRQLRHNRLVYTCVICSRRDVDKENQESIRRRKVIYRRRKQEAAAAPFPTENPD